MSYWLNTVLGDIRAEQGDGFIVLSGFRTKPFLGEVRRVFGTTRFENGMVTHVSGFSFRMRTFFLYDFYEVVKTLEKKGTRYFNKKIVVQIREALEKLPLIQRTLKDFPSKLDRKQLERFALTPLEKQEEFFKVYDQKTQKYGLKGYVLASPPGTGKTYMSLALMAMLNKRVVIIFSPNNALDSVWKKTLETVSDARTWVYPNDLLGYTYTHYVFSHENIKFALPHIYNIAKGGDVGIIVDECHRFNELKTDWTQNLIKICREVGSNDVLFMSGTPFKAMGRETIPFLMATDPTFGTVELEGFKKMFGASGNEAIQILASRIGRTMYKVDKAEVVSNDVTTIDVKVKIPNGDHFTLPAIRGRMEKFVKERVSYYSQQEDRYIRDYYRILSLFERSINTMEEKKEFERYKMWSQRIRGSRDLRLVREEVSWTNLYERTVIIPMLPPDEREKFRDCKSVFKYVVLKIQGEALGQVLGKDRTECNLQILKNIDNGLATCEKMNLLDTPWAMDDVFQTSNSKVVMFTDYVQVLQEAERLLKSRKYKPAVVYGQTNKDLVDIIHRFEKDPEVDPIIATYKSLSTAVPLIMADTCVLLNVPYRDYIYQQTTARVDRLGQKHPVKIYRYSLDTGKIPNISTRSKDIMEWSKKMVDALLGVTTDEESEELEVEFVSSFKQGFLSETSIKTMWDWISKD